MYAISRTDGRTMTAGGWSLPFTGEPMVTSKVITKTLGAQLRDFPAIFRPGEELAADEMRVTCTGSGNPVVRRGQAAASWVVECGNGDKFVFDVGGGSALTPGCSTCWWSTSSLPFMRGITTSVSTSWIDASELSTARRASSPLAASSTV